MYIIHGEDTKKTGIPTQEYRFLIFFGIDMAIYPK